MIKHIVVFRFKEDLDHENRVRAAQQLAKFFSPLKKLPSVIEYNTGINFNRGDNAWDFVIDSLFESREKLVIYQNSPEHKMAVKSASIFSKEKAVIDYEL